MKSEASSRARTKKIEARKNNKKGCPEEKQDYYSKKLSAERLKICYEIAPPRIKQYLKAEVDFVLSKIKPGDLVLELGCGYGRIIPSMASRARTVIGIDNSLNSLSLANKLKDMGHYCNFFLMNAVELGFKNATFDAVVCIQNGISAFKVDQRTLLQEALRVTRTNGTVLFSSYSSLFWKERLEWFRLQANYSLIGEIDEEATSNGVIICKDGFRATTVGPDKFISLAKSLGEEPVITEVDKSSIFCEIKVRKHKNSF